MTSGGVGATVVVVRPGLLTTIQDLGRPGRGRFGVSVGGVVDPVALRVANALLGNAPDAAAIEISGPGTVLRFSQATTFAMAGADLGAVLDGQVLAPFGAHDAPAGGVLTFGAHRWGARVVVAVPGGIVAPRILGSVATDLDGAFGGLAAPDDGRAMRAGDVLTIRAVPARAGRGGAATVARPGAPRGAGATTAGRAPVGWRSVYEPRDRLRFVPFAGGGVGARALVALRRTRWQVSVRSSRAGVRLEGPPIAIDDAGVRVSEPTAPGTIQIPPDGHPIILLADRPTTGGYPVAGHLASVDAARAAQLLPGDPVRMVAVTLTAARDLTRRLDRALARATGATRRH